MKGLLPFSYLSILHFACIYFLLDTVYTRVIDTTKGTKASHREPRLPEEITQTIASLLNPESKECMSEIILIHRKDFLNSNQTNPYRSHANQEKYLNRTLIQVVRRINKYSFYANKNFTGIRWVDPKNYNGEVRKLMQNYIQHISTYFEKNFFDTKSAVPEVILEQYQFFYNKFIELKKTFGKFYLFKGLRKFIRCVAKTNNSYTTNNFGENLLIGKMTIRRLLIHLKIAVMTMMDLISKNSMDIIAKSFKRLIMSMRGIPGIG